MQEKEYSNRKYSVKKTQEAEARRRRELVNMGQGGSRCMRNGLIRTTPPPPSTAPPGSEAWSFFLRACSLPHAQDKSGLGYPVKVGPFTPGSLPPGRDMLRSSPFTQQASYTCCGPVRSPNKRACAEYPSWWSRVAFLVVFSNF
jgi:hypothetical protein